MTNEIDRPVRDYLAARARAGGASVPASPELSRLAEELNALYWREVERLLSRLARESPDRFEFSPDERLLLDLGLLDWRLVPSGEALRPALLSELSAPGRSGAFSFSEWTARRFRQALLYGEMSPPDEDAPSASVIIRDLRGRLYLKLGSLFENLPGFDAKAVDLLLSGRIDATLDVMQKRLAQVSDERLTEQRRALSEIRARLLARARERARSPEDLSLFDALRDLDRQASERRASVRVDIPVAASRTLSPAERERFVLEEVRFVKGVLWLGVSGSGLARTWSVLLSDGPRTTKADLDQVLSRVAECDPALPMPASLLIAPYVGGGFYEWDRDTVFLPLVPTRSPEQAVVTAVAHYRVLLDALQDNGRLRAAYEAAFGASDDFHAAFTRDYRAWVLDVGRGFKAALDPRRFAFFAEYVGPQPSALYAPAPWADVASREGEEAVKQARLRMSKGEASLEDCFRLGVAGAQARQVVGALEALQVARRLAPSDGRTLLALGFLTSRTGDLDAARNLYNACMALAPNSLWAVYAAGELQKL
jgi:tetratricopeptide (TPR) repeat protein